ncbi:UNVERIFIED_CONTAM: hypothetical protein Sradi_4948200 [Sesamum radiatum]|uniref:Uncharacterized protein n=1 Tax=Sesamum radiatum TaxID=300843 RepID=A0AAW2ME11_SESRA
MLLAGDEPGWLSGAGTEIVKFEGMANSSTSWLTLSHPREQGTQSDPEGQHPPVPGGTLRSSGRRTPSSWEDPFSHLSSSSTKDSCRSRRVAWHRLHLRPLSGAERLGSNPSK